MMDIHESTSFFADHVLNAEDFSEGLAEFLVTFLRGIEVIRRERNATEDKDIYDIMVELNNKFYDVIKLINDTNPDRALNPEGFMYALRQEANPLYNNFVLAYPELRCSDEQAIKLNIPDQIQ
jgi:hypothetical protein